MTDPSAVAAYREAFAVNGVPVTVQRVSGFAPAVSVVAAVSVAAIVRSISPDGASTAQAGLGASEMGALEQGDRLVIVLADDLTTAGFPAPIAKGDQIVLPDSQELLNVVRVDPYRRALAGAIELYAAGIS